MENVFLTSLTTPEVRSLFRQELQTFFAENKILADQNLSIPLPDQNYDIEGLAEYLNCSVQTVHNLKKEGLIPFYRLGRKVYFKKSEVDAAARISELKLKKRG